MMSDKAQLIAMLQDEFNRWANLLNDLSEDQILTPMTPSHWTIKDLWKY